MNHVFPYYSFNVLYNNRGISKQQYFSEAVVFLKSNGIWYTKEVAYIGFLYSTRVTRRLATCFENVQYLWSKSRIRQLYN